MSTRERVTIADPKLQKLYDQHVTKWRNCQGCGLYTTRKYVVLFRGYLPCHILFVGEGPGESENALGHPFVGPAGQLLDSMVRAASSGFVKVGVTNIVACMPVTIDQEEMSGPTIRAPNKDEAVACRERLREIYEMAEPQAIVCLGKVATRFFGKIGPGVPIYDLIHPAAILRNEQVSSAHLQEKRWILRLAAILKELKL